VAFYSFIGGVNDHSSLGAFWNIVLDGSGGPKLPGTDSCGGTPCRGVVTVNSNGTYHLNQECTHPFVPTAYGLSSLPEHLLLVYAVAQASKAIIPKDSGGPFGQRIASTVNGNTNLVVSAFVTHRVSSSDWLRYSLVVLNQ